ncbi:MAG: adenosine-specific kinase [Candidatus Thermoplasmatota archaeon]|nr:adenosine-specific kinase [Candidatus Thermoplasmatota archaeon]
MQIESVKVVFPEDSNVVLGQSHFIKTVEDIYEAVVGTVPQAKFGVAFCEASGPCLVRVEGNDDELKKIAADNAMRIGAGHSFIIVLRESYPINILSRIKDVQEVCGILCATANSLEVLVVDNGRGRGIVGVIDGERPKGVEGENDIADRKDLLRKIGYKR